MEGKPYAWSVKNSAGLNIVIVGVILCMIFGPSLLAHIQYGMNPYVFNDDSKQFIIAFYQEDYSAEFYRSVINPLGYKAIYNALSEFYSVIVISKLLSYFLFMITLWALGRTAWKYGGPVMLFCTLSLTLSATVFLDNMIGGLPRSFAYPLLALVIYAASKGHIYFLAVLSVLGALFYPVVSVISGLTMATVLMIVPGKYQSYSLGWSLKKRLTVLGLTALVSGISVMPQLLQSKDYGTRLTIENVSDYPEVGIDGRYGASETGNHNNIISEVIDVGQETLVGAGEPFLSANLSQSVRIIWAGVIMAVLAIMLGLGFQVFVTNDHFAVRVGSFILAVIIAHAASVFFFPMLFYPQRYVVYTIPLVIVILIPVLSKVMVDRIGFLSGNVKLKGLLMVLPTLVIVLGFGGRVDARLGYTVDASADKPIYDYITTLPEEALIAGWPLGIVDNVPYLTRHKVLVQYETHQVFYEKYTKEMRRRMHALIDAYFAPDLEQLLLLRDEWNVDYLIVNTAHFGSKLPLYFQPFDDYLSDKSSTFKQSPPLLPSLRKQAVFSYESIFILDLHALSSSQ